MDRSPRLPQCSPVFHRAQYLGLCCFSSISTTCRILFKVFSVSKMNLFADDILLYHVISAPEDYVMLQMAVSLIEEWSVTNFLSFNTGKCKYMVISRKSHPISHSNPLKLFGSAMERVDCCKYLGLLINDKLSWSAHINSIICSRAKKILGLIYRRFYPSANQDTLK